MKNKNTLLILIGMFALALFCWGTIAYFIKYPFLMRASPLLAIVTAFGLMYVWSKVYKERKD